MKWEIVEECSQPYRCDQCGKVIKAFTRLYYCGDFIPPCFAHPDCKDDLEKQIERCLAHEKLIKGN